MQARYHKIDLATLPTQDSKHCPTTSASLRTITQKPEVMETTVKNHQPITKYEVPYDRHKKESIDVSHISVQSQASHDLLTFRDKRYDRLIDQKQRLNQIGQVVVSPRVNLSKKYSIPELKLPVRGLPSPKHQLQGKSPSSYSKKIEGHAISQRLSNMKAILQKQKYFLSQRQTENLNKTKKQQHINLTSPTNATITTASEHQAHIPKNEPQKKLITIKTDEQNRSRSRSLSQKYSKLRIQYQNNSSEYYRMLSEWFKTENMKLKKQLTEQSDLHAHSENILKGVYNRLLDKFTAIQSCFQQQKSKHLIALQTRTAQLEKLVEKISKGHQYHHNEIKSRTQPFKKLKRTNPHNTSPHNINSSVSSEKDREAGSKNRKVHQQTQTDMTHLHIDSFKRLISKLRAELSAKQRQLESSNQTRLQSKPGINNREAQTSKQEERKQSQVGRQKSLSRSKDISDLGPRDFQYLKRECLEWKAKYQQLLQKTLDTREHQNVHSETKANLDNQDISHLIERLHEETKKNERLVVRIETKEKELGTKQNFIDSVILNRQRRQGSIFDSQKK